MTSVRRLQPLRTARRWSPAEDDLLRAEYVRGKGPALAARLGRTTAAVNIRVQDLGLHTPKPLRIQWTAVNDATLTADYQRVPVADLAARLGTTPAAVMKRANGLRLGRLVTCDRLEIAQLRQENERLRDRPPPDAAHAPSDDARRLAVLISWRLQVISAAQAAVVLGVPVERLPVELGRAAKRGLDVVTQALDGGDA
jgi:biotin operon repressor